MMDAIKFKNMCKMGGSCFWLAVLVLVAVLFYWKAAGWFFQVDRNSYQAVFLTNGQVYFGKLKLGTGDFLTVRDAHYLVVATNQQQQAGIPPISLNILNLEIQPQAPVDTVYLSKNQVLFWENLKTDSPAIRVIEEQKAARAQQ